MIKSVEYQKTRFRFLFNLENVNLNVSNEFIYYDLHTKFKVYKKIDKKNVNSQTYTPHIV